MGKIYRYVRQETESEWSARDKAGKITARFCSLEQAKLFYLYNYAEEVELQIDAPWPQAQPPEVLEL